MSDRSFWRLAKPVRAFLGRALLCVLAWACWASPQAYGANFQIAIFTLDVTIPLGHRCMGTLPTKSQRIADPLELHGLVLLGSDQPIVLCAVDWCEIRNQAYDQFRDVLARAAGTTRERVLLSALHQHDAPVIDRRAAEILAEAGLEGELYDAAFFTDVLRRVEQAVQLSLRNPTPITHWGVGMARVDGVASNRRVVEPDGRVTYGRGSRSGSVAHYAEAPAGEIDPVLRTLSFWQGERAVAAIHAYATHPMSYYGQGEVSSDFVGLARTLRQRDDLGIRQIYLSGCSGDVTAGKFNDGSVEQRRVLAERLHAAMRAAWQNQQRHPLGEISFRNTQLQLPFHDKPELSVASLQQELHDATVAVERRIWCAMSLASRERVAANEPIDVPCIDFGTAQLLLCPGETFVAYQLYAQSLRPESSVITIGYGECWPGYIPTRAAFAEGFDDDWLWVGPAADDRLRQAIAKSLGR